MENNFDKQLYEDIGYIKAEIGKISTLETKIDCLDNKVQKIQNKMNWLKGIAAAIGVMVSVVYNYLFNK